MAGKKLSFPVIAACIIACFSIAGIALQTYFKLNPPVDELEITQINVEQVHNSYGESVIRVKGKVFNETGGDQRLPPIAIILRSPDGVELVRWVHRSSLAQLSSGDKSLFSTSIAYQSSGQVFAEAKFQN